MPQSSLLPTPSLLKIRLLVVTDGFAPRGVRCRGDVPNKKNVPTSSQTS